MSVRYPLAHVTYGAEEIGAVDAALFDGQTTCGPRVKRFETQFASYVGRQHAIMVNSGSSADLLVAFGLGPARPGDEVLLPAVTWPTQVWSCLMAGYRVRLVDVDPATLQMDVGDLEQQINPSTRAIFAVHVLGSVGNMDDLCTVARDNKLALIEDCCEAMGSRWNGRHVGTFGQAAAFSFFFSHLINTMEGGMVVTDSAGDERLYRLWRSHGWEPKKNYRFWFTTWGMNIRPTELQGAFGGVQMNRIEQFLDARTRNYARLAAVTYLAYPSMLDGVTVLPGCTPGWHGFPLMVRTDAPFSRDTLCAYLESWGIETRPIIAGNLYRQPAIMYDERIVGRHDLPGADAIHTQGFYIGIASVDNQDAIGFVDDTLAQFIKTQ